MGLGLTLVHTEEERAIVQTIQVIGSEHRYVFEGLEMRRRKESLKRKMVIQHDDVGIVPANS